MQTGPRGTKLLADYTVFLHGGILLYKCSFVESHKGNVTESIRKAWKTGQLLPCPDCFPFSATGRRITIGKLIPDIDLYNSSHSVSRSDQIKKFVDEDLSHVDLLLVIGKYNWLT